MPMLGLSTYAYAWRRHPDASTPWSLLQVVDDAERLGVRLVQICDAPELENADPHALRCLRRATESRGMLLETGTKGVEPDHLRRHLVHALDLGATFVRSMLSSPRGVPTLPQAIAALGEVMPDFERNGVTLGLETYEQFSTAELIGVVEAVGSSHLGICLDPGNSVARLERPADVIAATAPHVVNLHIKDFAFSRSEAMIGFRFAGAPLGQGLLDYEAMVGVLASAGRHVNEIIEHWLPRQSTIAGTCELERQWVDDSVAYLRSRPVPVDA